MLFKDEEIEVLDLEDMPLSRSAKYEEENKKENKKEKKKNNKKQDNNINKKMFVFQIVFCSISFLFILGCCFFYGSRLIKYYKIYNPKTSDGSNVVLLSNEITSKSEIVYEDSGLYINGGIYIYKGDVSNNYLRYNNMLWRITKINKDGTIDIILDDYINILNWDNENNEFNKSNIYKYLNNYFLNNINQDMLVSFNVCLDKFDKLSDLSCNKVVENNYVGLLDVSNFLNSVVDGKTYLSNDEEIFWLSNQGNEKIWHTNGTNISMSEGSNFYEVRPVLTLKGTTILYKGDGSKENPYIIEEGNKIGIGSYVKLGEDIWNVYQIGNDIKLSLNDNLNKQYHFSYKETVYDVSDKDSVAMYLNTTYLDSLSYKDLIVESEWYNGTYETSYKDIETKKVKAKVGLLNISDFKFNSELDNYLLMTSNKDGLIYAYGEVLKVGKSTMYRNIRPCIAISKDTKIESGNGTLENPYILEV